MVKNIVRLYRSYFPAKVPKGAPKLREFRKMTIAERKAIKLKRDGKEVLAIDILKQNAKGLPAMIYYKDGKEHKINHEKELIENYLFGGFEGVYNYLKSVKNAKQRPVNNKDNSGNTSR